MTSIIESNPQLLAYQPAFLSLILLCLMVLIQGFLAGAIGYAKSEEIPGRPLQGTHKDQSFRIIRTYGNSTETLTMLLAAAFLAMLAGVNPTFVNWLVGLHLLVRIAYSGVYYAGYGKTGGGARTIIYVIGLFTNIALALLTVYAMLA